MNKVRAEQFADFFEAVHGVRPFPWQERLARQVMETGAWPRLLDLPTGTGKTACLDIAVFALAAAAGNEDRRQPVRTVLVVDRRTIVDQTYSRACKIRDALAQAGTDGVLAWVRDALAGLSREGIPLEVAILRGGMARDDSWARSPDQPLLAVSTVDQVGSRLLFRGYGISDSMKPLHAGLLGNDTLFILDEVHLSRPFQETLEAIHRRYRGWAEERLPDRWHVVQLSATPGQADPDAAFRLAGEDRDHPVLRRRLAARKPVRLVEIGKTRGGDRSKPIAEACVALVRESLQPDSAEQPGRAIGIVVNRVLTAQAVAEHLMAALRDKADVLLVTGRMRPLDRVDLELRLIAGAGVGRSREGAARPLVVVSTQCIEAGADLDFDVLVTECASLDALRQRFGRLNRLGDCSDAWGAILLAPDSAEDDPVYGPALLATWGFLSGLEQPDFGIDALQLPPPESMPALLPPVTFAPVLLPAHIDAWVQTAPAPYPDPDVSLWLHGPRDSGPEVQVVWRADLSEEALREVMEAENPDDPGSGERSERASLEDVLAVLDACPPTGLEALSVPLWAARRWLEEEHGQVDFGDVEGETAIEENGRRPRTAGRPAILWRGEETRVSWGRLVRPGDTLVVPSTYGGLRYGSWHPESGEPVPDLGDRARLERTGKPVLRLHPAVLRSTTQADGGTGEIPDPPLPVTSEASEIDEAARVQDWLESVVRKGEPEWLVTAAGYLRQEMAVTRKPSLLRLRSLVEPTGEYFALVGRGKVQKGRSAASTEDDTGSLVGTEVPLHAHLEGVKDWAEDFARRCGLPATVAADIALAAGWHDLGKADPRFQILLHGGSEFRARVAEEPIAKSSRTPEDRQARDLARVRAGYPAGYRHEVLSAALLQGDASLISQAKDPDLVLHLLTSHHGHGRPLAPVVQDPEPVEVVYKIDGHTLRSSSRHGLDRLDSGVCDRFWRLNRRYGWWGLAWMEAILRLADHRRSEEEERGLSKGVKR